MKLVTLADAYAEYTRGHGTDIPLRTPEEFRSAVHATVGEYERIDDLFWEVLFSSEWNWAPKGTDLRLHLLQLMDEWDAENYQYEFDDDEEDDNSE